jgi:hypothetical protein
MTSSSRKGLLIMRASLLFVLLASACHAEVAFREPDEYAGCATDEDWARFDDVRDIVSSDQAPLLIAPVGNAALGASPVDFTWQVSPSVPGTPGGDASMDCPQWSTGFTTLHLPPVSGTVYDLQLLSGDLVTHRVLTTLQKWTPSPSVWSALGERTMSVRLRRVTLLDNDRKDGPFVAPQAPSFSVR